MRIPVIIDCDTGVDDALAIICGLASDQLDIRAFTTVAGNQTLEKTSVNTLNLVSFLGADIKVAKGAEKPLVRKLQTAEHVHGSGGLGGVILPKASQDFYEKNAVDTILEEAVNCNGKLELIAIGPLTNVAEAILAHPSLKQTIKRITLMGGSIDGGNHTPSAEFNIFVDPEAAQVVFNSGIPIVMVGLEVTEEAFITKSEIENLKIWTKDSKSGPVIKALLENTLQICTQFGYKGAVLHDPLALCYVLDESLIKTKAFNIQVETQGEITRGKTVADRYFVTDRKPNAAVGLEVDRVKFVGIIDMLLEKYIK
jgi:pyrimidine-specific ribonucleoside hydrolase